MTLPLSYPHLRHHLLATIALGLMLEGCCNDVVYPAGEECLELEDPDAECPSEDAATTELDVDAVLGPGQKWPERTYEQNGVLYSVPAECCYETGEFQQECFGGGCNGFGRPLLDGSEAVVAKAVRRDGSWIARGRRLPDTQALDMRTRRQLGRTWLERGLLEHAAVLSFARFSADLIAMGAPSELVAAAARAGAEEVAHAELCFAIAEAYRGESWGPGRLEAPRSSGRLTGVRFASQLALEGCIHETIGVAELAARADRAEDEALRLALRRLATEETRHAALAWRALAWICREDDEARRAATIVFRRFAASLPAEAEGPIVEHPLARHGELEWEESARVMRAAFHEVVLPAARRVCGVTSEPTIQPVTETAA